MREEVYRDIEGYEGLYQISNRGNVKSNNSQDKKPRILKYHLDKYGYPRVILCKYPNKKGYTVHRLVAKAFLNNTLNLPQVNHLNGIKTDNAAENLEWCTNRQNFDHAVSKGLKSSNKGNLNISAKLTEEDVLRIRSMANNIASMQSVASLYKVHYSCIYKIIKRHTWKHI